MECPYKSLCKNASEKCEDENVTKCEIYHDLHMKDAIFTFTMMQKRLAELERKYKKHRKR